MTTRVPRSARMPAERFPHPDLPALLAPVAARERVTKWRRRQFVNPENNSPHGQL